MRAKPSSGATGRGELLPARFNPVSVTGAHLISLNRNPAGGTLYPSGRFDLNRAGSDGVVRLCGTAADQANMGTYFAVDLAKSQIACRFVAAEQARVVPFRYNRSRKTFTLYLHDVFRESPAVRPIGRQELTVAFQQCDDYEYMIIQLALALPKPKGASKSAASGSSSGAASDGSSAQPTQAVR